MSKVLHPGVRYRHVILTIPEQLRLHFYKPRFDGDLLSSFMRTGYECLEDVVKHARKHTLKIGAIMVVQSHGR